MRAKQKAVKNQIKTFMASLYQVCQEVDAEYSKTMRATVADNGVSELDFSEPDYSQIIDYSGE